MLGSTKRTIIIREVYAPKAPNSVSENRDTHQVVVRVGILWGEILTRGENLKTRGEKGSIRAFCLFLTLNVVPSPTLSGSAFSSKKLRVDFSYP